MTIWDSGLILVTCNFYSKRKETGTHLLPVALTFVCCLSCVTFLLQANVMLEYTLEDATDLLVKNIDAAKKNLSYVEHDLDFLS